LRDVRDKHGIPLSVRSGSASSSSMPFIGGYVAMGFRRARFEYGTVMRRVAAFDKCMSS
jgi:hypothetical protein